MDALEHRPRPPRRQLDGRPRGARGRPAPPRARRRRSACCVRRSRSSSAASTRSCACCAPSSACCPTASAARPSPASSGACSPTATWSTPSVADIAVDEFQRIYALRRRPLRVPLAARNIYLDGPFGRGGFYPRLAELEPPGAVRVGLARQAGPRGLPAPRQRMAAPAPSRSCSRAAATSPRSSGPSRPTGCWSASSRAPTRRRAARRRGGTAAERPPRPRLESLLMAATSQATSGRNGTAPAATGIATRRARRARAGLSGRCWPSVAAVRGPGAAAHPRRRPRRARPRLHPREPAAACGCCRQPLLPGRGARPGQHPRGGPGAARRQPLRRQPDARHDASSRSPSPPTSASSGAFYQLAHNLVLSMPGLGLPAQVRHRRRVAGEREEGAGLGRRAARLPRRRLRGPPARPGSATRSTSTAARASSAWRSSRTCRSSRWSPSAARRPRSSSPAARGWPACCGSTGCSA